MAIKFEPVAPKKRGRPPKPESERKGRNLTFRMRDEVRDWLTVRAAKSGRTVSDEINRILQANLAKL
jgi:NADPH-dependent glutamate synthase beta subunit-like oxidoreductase